MKLVTVRYERPGKSPREWEQKLLADTENMIVSSFVFRLEKPFSPKDETLIEDGFYGVLFDFFDRWYNVVKIYDEHKDFRGYYSDIREPPERTERGYRARDLFLDLWVEPNGEYLILDRGEYQEADLSEKTRNSVKRTLERMEKMIARGAYPPEEVTAFEIGAHEVGSE